MKEYEIVVAAYEKNYIRVMANSEKEALEIAKRNTYRSSMTADGYLVWFDNCDTEIIYDGEDTHFEAYVKKYDNEYYKCYDLPHTTQSNKN